MSDFLATTWSPLCEFLGSLIRPLGGLVLGAVIGWLTASTFLDEAKEWQLKIAVFLGLLGAFICMQIYSGLATTGLFAIGVGAAVLLLGVRKSQPAKKK